MFKVPEKNRITKGCFYSYSEHGNNGLFIINHNDITLCCIVSDGSDWEHVSVTLRTIKTEKTLTRCPTWDEMTFVKNQFWDDTDTVLQYHPAKKDYVNCHPYCLHLWRSIKHQIIKPPDYLIG